MPINEEVWRIWKKYIFLGEYDTVAMHKMCRILQFSDRIYAWNIGKK